MELWLAVVIETQEISGEITYKEPVPVEAFLSEEDCWQFVNSGAIRRGKYRERADRKLDVIYSEGCRPVTVNMS